MTDRLVSRLLVWTSMALLSGAAGGTLAAAPVAEPNVIFILADDLGYRDVGCFGSTFYETPHVDRLAREGMKFTDAYAACSVCSPTRASLMTGRYPARIGLTNAIPGSQQQDFKLLQVDRLDYLNEEGFIPFLEAACRDVGQAWKKYYDWPDSYARYVQYFFSRYQAHNAILSPIHYDFIVRTIPPLEGGSHPGGTMESLLQRAATNGLLANEGFIRSHRFVTDWLKQADPKTGLIPRNLYESRDFWNPEDAAADNYPFMVLTAFFTDRELFRGRLREMLRTERQLTSRLGPLPDHYSFSRENFVYEEPSLDRIIFGASEYVKDGLLPLTEWLGSSPWSERMIEIVDGIWNQAPVATPYGHIPSESHEINGEMLQALSRIYWMTGDRKYLEWAVRLGDYYLLGDHHPTRDSDRLRLRDHGCEIVSGLTELYATVHFAWPEKKKTYAEPIHAMLQRVLEVGRNEHGLFYNVINPQTGEVIDPLPADTFGYTYNAFQTVYLVDSTAAYREAVLAALNALKENYHNFTWERGSADGDADAIEGALNLYNREPVPSTAEWIDREIQFMWSKQDVNQRSPDDRRWDGSGIIEGWHGDGNFARTTLYYCLWKTQGLHVQPWRKDVVVGAVTDDDNRLIISISAGKNWSGSLHFDRRRHARQMHLPLDWPRINQFPEWFTIEPEASYTIRDLNSHTEVTYSGQRLLDGLHLSLTPGTERHLVVEMASRSANQEPL